MSRSKNMKGSGYLFISTGCMFFLAASLGEQVAFCGVGVAFIAIGASYVARAKRARGASGPWGTAHVVVLGQLSPPGHDCHLGASKYALAVNQVLKVSDKRGQEP